MAKQSLRNHPKFKRACRRLGLQPYSVWGLLDLLWNTQHQRGRPEIGDAEDVESNAEWDGDLGTFATVIAERGCNFIDESPAGSGLYVVHDFWDHAPDWVKKKRRRHEARDASKGDDGDDEPTRTDDAGEVAGTNGAPDPPPPTVLLAYPCMPGKRGKGKKPNPDTWPLTDVFVKGLEELFPGVEVMPLARSALAHVKVDGLKTYDGMPRFLTKWIDREVGWGRAGRRQPLGAAGARGGAHAPFHRELGGGGEEGGK